MPSLEVVEVLLADEDEEEVTLKNQHHQLMTQQQCCQTQCDDREISLIDEKQRVVMTNNVNAKRSSINSSSGNEMPKDFPVNENQNTHEENLTPTHTYPLNETKNTQKVKNVANSTELHEMEQVSIKQTEGDGEALKVTIDIDKDDPNTSPKERLITKSTSKKDASRGKLAGRKISPDGGGGSRPSLLVAQSGIEVTVVPLTNKTQKNKTRTKSSIPVGQRTISAFFATKKEGPSNSQKATTAAAVADDNQHISPAQILTPTTNHPVQQHTGSSSVSKEPIFPSVEHDSNSAVEEYKAKQPGEDNDTNGASFLAGQSTARDRLPDDDRRRAALRDIVVGRGRATTGMGVVRRIIQPDLSVTMNLVDRFEKQQQAMDLHQEATFVETGEGVEELHRSEHIVKKQSPSLLVHLNQTEAHNSLCGTRDDGIAHNDTPQHVCAAGDNIEKEISVQVVEAPFWEDQKTSSIDKLTGHNTTDYDIRDGDPTVPVGRCPGSVSDDTESTQQNEQQANAIEEIVDLVAHDEDETPITADNTKTLASVDDILAEGDVPLKDSCSNEDQAKTEVAVIAASIPEPSDTSTTKFQRMHDIYSRRLTEILAVGRDGLEDEAVNIPLPEIAVIPDGTVFSTESFPDFAVSILASLVEGQHLSLSQLAGLAVNQLNQIFATSLFTEHATLTKIKLIAERKNFTKASSTIDVFEDTCPNNMWRWEVVSLEWLPTEVASKIRKARNARKKFSLHYAAVSKFVTMLREVDTVVGSTPKRDKLLVRISQQEERVLKFEREEEKARLAKTNLQNQIARASVTGDEKAKDLEKQIQEDEKKKEKQRKKEEAARERQRVKEEATEMKRKKEAERLASEEKTKAKQQALLQKQKNRLRSFFAGSTPSSGPTDTTGPRDISQSVPSGPEQKHSQPRPAEVAFQEEVFRTTINSTNHIAQGPVFPMLSSQAKRSRRRQTKRVLISVFVTIFPENPLEAHPYAEIREVEIVNKYKFFRFHEDVRPAYYGTWSKTSEIVTGRRPFGKDTTLLDYDNDSEAEWEEGDDDMGIDVENDMNDDDEKDDDEASSNEDGWLAPDDELDNEADEETKALRRKILRNAESQTMQLENRVCIIAPNQGKPVDTCFSGSSFVEGFDPKEVYDIMQSYEALMPSKSVVFLDVFPNAMVDESDVGTEQNSSPTTTNEMTDDNLKTLARFVHFSSLGSKDKVVDELRSSHPSITNSRSHALRVLDGVAEKKKNCTGGVYWEVRPEVLERLGLHDLLATTQSAKESEAKKQVMRSVAALVHNSTINSKEKLVDELRLVHGDTLSSKAEALRWLELVAEKKRNTDSGGVFWQVKDDIRAELGDLIDLPSSPPLPPPSAGETLIPSTNDGRKKESAHVPRRIDIAGAQPCQPQTMSISGSRSTQQVTTTTSTKLQGQSVQLLASFLKRKKSS